jgi:GntR family histidine utilization transcriptional repressor
MKSRASSSRRVHGRADAAAPASEPSLALYEQVKEHITRRIQSGEWPAGHRLPSEHELVAQFGISRMTANRALRELVDQGRIVRVAGVGSFVAEEKPQSTLLNISNIASEIRGRGHDYGFRLLVSERVSASPDVAAWMDVRMGESLFHCVCLHLEDGLPVQLEDRYVNPRIVPAFLEQDFSVSTPSEYLVRNVPFDQIEHLVDAGASDAGASRTPGHGPGRPLPAADAPDLDPRPDRHAGALPASRCALSPGQPGAHGRQPEPRVAADARSAFFESFLYRHDRMSVQPETLKLSPGDVDLAQLRRVFAGDVRLALAGSAREGLAAAHAAVQSILDAGLVAYGINTGFGKLAQTVIPVQRLAELQRNLVLSHAVGTGSPLPDGVVRLVLATKAVSLARGHSGVRAEIVDALLALFNAGVLPRIPAKGSVGPRATWRRWRTSPAS